MWLETEPCRALFYEFWGQSVELTAECGSHSRLSAGALYRLLLLLPAPTWVRFIKKRKWVLNFVNCVF